MSNRIVGLSVLVLLAGCSIGGPGDPAGPHGPPPDDAAFGGGDDAAVLSLSVGQDGAALEVVAEVDAADGPLDLWVLTPDGTETLVLETVTGGVWSTRIPLEDPCRQLGTEVTVGVAFDTEPLTMASIGLDGVGLDIGDDTFVVVEPELIAVCTTAAELRVTVAVEYEVTIESIDAGGFAFLQPIEAGCGPTVAIEDCNSGFAGSVFYQLVLDAGVWNVTADGAPVALVFAPVVR